MIERLKAGCLDVGCARHPVILKGVAACLAVQEGQQRLKSVGDNIRASGVYPYRGITQRILPQFGPFVDLTGVEAPAL